MSSNKILEEYYRIFGKKKYDNLFDLGDESYKALRQEILDSPLECFDMQKLPFEEFSIEPNKKNVARSTTSHAHYTLSELIARQEKKSKISDIIVALLVKRISVFSPIFNLKGNDDVLACGYYEPEERLFHILPGSTVSMEETSNYSETNSAKRRQIFLDEVCQKERNFYRVVKDIACTYKRQIKMQD